MNKAEQKISQTVLNDLLANESVLLFQTLNYHWNLVGPEFHDYHLLFDNQYNQIFQDLDKIAERVRAVGGFALASMKDLSKAASLKEDSSIPKPKQMVLNLLKHYEVIIEQIRAAIITLDKKTHDFGTINFLEELLTQHEKTAWMLRSLAGKE